MIQLIHVSKRYDQRLALSDVSFEIGKGEFVLLMGSFLAVFFPYIIVVNGSLLTVSRDHLVIIPWHNVLKRDCFFHARYERQKA